MHQQPQFPSLNDQLCQPPSRTLNLPVSLTLLVCATQTGSNAAWGIVGSGVEEVLAPHNTHNTSTVSHHTLHLTRRKPAIEGARNSRIQARRNLSPAHSRSVSPKIPPTPLTSVTSPTRSLASSVPGPVLKQFKAAVASAKSSRVSTAALPSRRVKGCLCINPCSSLLHCLTPVLNLPKRHQPKA